MSWPRITPNRSAMATQTDLNAQLSASARALSAAQDGDQLALLPEVRRIDTNKLDEVLANGEEERKRGRPKGAENLATGKLREMITRAGGHPLLNMARWAALTPEELAVRLGITKAEAFDRLMSMWDKLAPYTAARLAPVDEKGRAVTPIAMFIGGETARAGDLPPWHRSFQTVDGEYVENQGLSLTGSDAVRQKSHDEKSHGA